MSNDLVTMTVDSYPALLPETIETIRENLGGEEVRPSDLCRIKVPAGGQTTWLVPAISGDDEPTKALDGVALHIARRRAYWPDANPTGQPPACQSSDCRAGVGQPGGDCRTCPLNQFGSAVRVDGRPGRGKACKESRLVFLLRPGRILPDVVVVPSGSLTAMRKFLLQLQPHYQTVVLRLSLRKAMNKDGIDYAEVIPAVIGRLSEETAAAIVQYAKTLGTVFAHVEVERGDVEGGSGAAGSDIPF